MATRRVYHHQFLSSGIELTDKTLGFLPAHAMGRISSDFKNWTTGELYFNNVSDRPRNPKNAADLVEMEAINYFRKNPDEKERFIPFKSGEGKSFYHFSAPIWVEEYCLKCHGKREDAPETIRTRYASSFNYEIGDLRGVMSIKLPSAHLNTLVWSNFKIDLWIHLGGFFSLFMLVSWLLNRYVNTPLVRLTSGLESVAGGNFSQPPIEGLTGEMAIVGRAFEKMSKELGQRDKELAKMQKLESVGILAGGIAHDFNNYLQGILGNIEIAKIYTDSNDKIYTNLTESEKAVLRAKNLTQQLLTFSKGGEPVKKLISVPDLIKESSSFVTSGSNIRCELDLEDDLCLVDVDKGQFNQVFHNLFINANQAMPKGGVIKVSANKYNVEEKDLLPLQEGRYVKITIEDQGTGIPQENLQKIFDPYFTTKGTGSGLGLATVFSIIKKHDGYVEAESEPEVGTTFNIYLPASSEEISRKDVQGKADTSRPKPAEEERVQKEILLDGSRVLLMDDDLLISKSVSQQLKILKCEVRAVKNGTEAIKLYKETMALRIPFDAVILDLTIPGGMGGAETMKKLLEIDPDVTAIVASGYSDDPIMADFNKYGFKGMVEKPYEIHELIEILQKVMKKE